MLFTASQSLCSQMSNDSFASSRRRFHTWKQLTADREKWNIEKSCWTPSLKFSFRAWHLFTTILCSSSLTLSNSPWIYFLRVASHSLLHKHVSHTICCFLSMVLYVIVTYLIIRSRTQIMCGWKYHEAIIRLKFWDGIENC